MVLEAELYLNRAEDEFLLAKKDMDISIDIKLKEVLSIGKEKTFFYLIFRMKTASFMLQW